MHSHISITNCNHFFLHMIYEILPIFDNPVNGLRRFYSKELMFRTNFMPSCSFSYNFHHIFMLNLMRTKYCSYVIGLKKIVIC